MKEIVIKLGEGGISTGFTTVNIEFKDCGKTQWEDRGSLIGSPELADLLKQWLFLYPAALNNPRSPTVIFDDETITNISSQDIKQLEFSLRRSMNEWLKYGSFSRIIERVRTALNLQDSIIIAIGSERPDIWQLPWHFWSIFEDYPHAVEVFCKPSFSSVRDVRSRGNGKVNILGLLGEDPALDLNLAFLTTLPQTNLQIVQTTSAYEISDVLTTSQAWDIFIFNGHGDTINDEVINLPDGLIYLDNQTPLEIDRLKHDLNHAVEHGLQIAIFNCCSGLGLADRLSDINLPYLIVMRERIPDRVAQQFLTDILTQYSQGNSFPTAFKYARQRLVLAPGSFARFATWLPVLFHNPLSHHVTWQDLAGRKFSHTIISQISNICKYINQPKQQIWAIVGISLCISILAVSLRSNPQVSSLENQIIDRLQPTPISRSKVTIVNYDLNKVVNSNATSINVLGVSNNAEILAKEIAQISQRTKPLAWMIDISFGFNSEGFDRTNTILGCTDRIKPIELNNYSPSELICNNQSNALENLSSKLNLRNQFQQDIRLNPSRIDLIDQINLSEINNLPTTTAAKLFDDKIIIIGTLSPINPLESNVIRDALALDSLIRANDQRHPFSLFIPWKPGIQLIWILTWLIITSLLIFRQTLPLLIPLTITLQIAISITLIFHAYCAPILFTTLSMLLATMILTTIKQTPTNPSSAYQK